MHRSMKHIRVRLCRSTFRLPAGLPRVAMRGAMLHEPLSTPLPGKLDASFSLRAPIRLRMPAEPVRNRPVRPRFDLDAALFRPLLRPMLHRGALLLSLLLMLPLLASFSGCGASDADASARSGTVAADPLLLQPSTVVGYLIGSRHEAMDGIVDALNARLQKTLNTSIELRYLNWGEMDTRYPIVLSSGEGVDFIYTASWCNYSTEALKGAFLALDEDTLRRRMPLHMAATPDEAWKDAELAGRIYMIPTATPDVKVPAMLIRGDLRRKYDLPAIKRFGDLEPYLSAIAENEPGMVPLQLDNGYDVTCCWFTLMGENGFLPGVLTDGITYDAEDPAHRVVSFTDEPAFAAYRTACSTMKDWYDKGYLNRNPFSNTVRSKDAFQEGLSGVGFGNLYDVETNVLVAAERGFDVEVVPLLSATGHYPRDPYTVNGVAISASSRQPERTMMVLDMLMEDPECNLLGSFGIRGTHYEIGDDGRMTLIMPEAGHSTPHTHTGFWFTDKKQWPEMADWPEQYAALRRDAAGMLLDSPLVAFAYATVESAGEATRVGEVFRKYGDPLAVGAVADVDETLRVLSNLLKTAGVETLKADAQAQIDEYLKERGK